MSNERNAAPGVVPKGRRTALSVRQRPGLQEKRISLSEVLNRVLNKGAVVAGDIVVSVAGVDLLYVGVNLVVSSVETMRQWSAATEKAREVFRESAAEQGLAAGES